MVDLSIVIPAYNEEESIPELYEELCEVLNAFDRSFELIFIDDASTDGTWTVLDDLQRRDSHVHAIHLSCNTKKGGALQAGFQSAQGETIITLDADLQDDPHCIPSLLTELDAGADVVIGWKVNRQDPFLSKRLPSKVINLCARFLFQTSFKDMNSGFKAYRRSALLGVDVQKGRYRYLPHLQQRHGRIVVEVPVHHRSRKYGSAKFSWMNRCRGARDIISFYREQTRPDDIVHMQLQTSH